MVRRESCASRQVFARRLEGKRAAGLSWFKPIANEHIKQMHQLKMALEACGVQVEILKTRRPGRIIWQDEHQLVAEPGAKRF